jgi:hypothetical protein
VVPRGTCTARRCAFPEWLEVASGDAWCLMSHWCQAMFNTIFRGNV